MKFYDCQRKHVARLLLASAAVVGLGLAFATPDLAQSGRPTATTTPRNDRERTGTTQSAIPNTDDFGSTNLIPKRPEWGFPPAIPTNPSRTTLDDLKKDLDELRALAARLQETINGPTLDYPAVATQAAAIHRLAKCMQSTAGLRGADDDELRDQSKETIGQLASAIGESIKHLLNNPVFQRSNTIDAELITETGLELRKVVRFSAELRTRAETSEPRVSTPKTSTAATPGKVSRKRTPYLQLTLDCDVWTADRFLHQAAKVKTDRPVKIEGKEIKVKHHELLVRQLIDLEDCMPCSSDEKATAAGERYAVLLKDFRSYELKGRTFAYHVLYEIVRTKDGKITSHLVQPVSLHYVDAEGQGEFELVEEGRSLARLPEWVKDLDFPR